MSMIGSSFLDEAVVEKGITQPNEIFFEVRKGFINALKQTGEQGQQKDGMDATLCALSRNGKGTQWTRLECAVANNPVLIIRSGNNPVVDNGVKLEPILEENGLYMYEIKADRQPVGYKTEEMTPYTHHAVDLLKEDALYTFSDGYQDQFGGPKGRKFMIKRQKELLMGLYGKTMQERIDGHIIRVAQFQMQMWRPGAALPAPGDKPSALNEQITFIEIQVHAIASAL